MVAQKGARTASWSAAKAIHRTPPFVYQMLDLLPNEGVQKPPWFTPVEFARVVKTPQMAPLVEEATAAYNELRYGGRHDAAPRMMRVLEQIRQL